MAPAARQEFYWHMDAANVDLKGFTEDFYFRICGGHLQPVLDTLVYLKHETGVWFEITTLLIPGHNDSADEIDAMTRWGVANLGPDVPWHFTAFHPDWKMMDVPHTPAATLTRAREIAIKNGVRYAYTGNIHDEAGGSTYCHQCGMKLIGRDWYTITAWNLVDGRCPQCHAPLPGHFTAQHGSWGSQRLPVRLKDYAATLPA
jgi:pyruvate formate lyase activating enzyme